MRRLVLLVALVCASWSANAQTCGPLGRQLIWYPNTVCPNSEHSASAAYAEYPDFTWPGLSWSITNGTIVGPANADFVRFSVGSSEPVTLTLTATGSTGCSYTESQTIQISEQVPIDIMSNGSVCPNGIESASAMSAHEFTSYAWSIENGELLQINGSNVQFRAGATGAVQLSVTATGSSPSCTGSGSNAIPIVPPNAYIYYMSTMCANTTQTVGGAYGYDTFLWSIEGGEIIGDSTSQYVTIQAGAAGTINLTLNASSSSSGCSVTSTKTITVNDPPPAPQVSAPTTAICNAEPAEASVSNASAYEYVWWDIEGGSFENWQNVGPVVHFRPDVYWTDHVTLTAHGYAQGCQTITTVQVPVTPGAAIITPGSQTICPGSTITLTAPAAASYSWSTGETTRSITVGAAGYYTANVVYENGCRANGSVSVTLFNTPPATITASGPTTFCEGGSVTLTSSAASSYLWSTGATTQSITVSAGGTYTVTTTSANGCSSSASQTVTVNPPPAPVVTVSNQYTLRGPATNSMDLVSHSSTLDYCGSVDVVLMVSQPQNYASFLWSTGATTPSIHVTSAGTYSVTVTNAAGCSGSDSVTINVTPTPPAPVITASPLTELCANDPVTLTASAADSYLWSTGATTRSITVTEAGSYSVTARVNGCTSPTSSINLTRRSVDVTASGPTTFCAGDSVTLAASAADSYLWSTGATTQSITVTSSGDYSVTGTFADGCSMTSAPTTVTTSSIASSISADRTTVCPGGSIQLTSSVSGGAAASYQWYGFGGTPISGATSPTLTLTPANNGYVFLRVTDGNGCTATSNTVVYSVDEPSASITVLGPTTFCAGGSTTLMANAGASYLWSNGATTPSIVVTASGSYSVTVTDAAGCSATSAPTTVTVNANPPVPVVTANGPTTFCAGGSVTLTAPGGYSYSWSNGATTQSIDVTTSGSYSVTVTNASGCSATSAASTVTVNANPATPVISASGPTTFCAGGSVTLTAPAGYTYLWSNNATTRSITVSASGSFSVTVSNGNCSTTSAPTTVTVNPSTAITAQPQNVTMRRNETRILSVTATGTPALQYQWYEGLTGDTSKPAGTGPQKTVGPYSKKGTFRFWVRVTSSTCSGSVVNSTTATVTVN